MMGAGYVGLVSGAGLADFGLSVCCVDVNSEKIRMLNEGRLPIYEPGLHEVIRRNLANGRLMFSENITKAIQNSLVVFVAVGTDSRTDGRVDLSQVWAAVDMVGESAAEYKVLVIKSTVPVGTAASVQERLRHVVKPPVEIDVVSNPEFLREGSGVEDFFHPNRIVIGSSSGRAAAIVKDIYRPLYLIETPIISTSWQSAELIKYASNSFLALKVSFVNELANLCEAIGPSADVHVVCRALGLDKRIGSKFLHPGAGFGGYCFPKDTRGLLQIAKRYGEGFKTIQAAVDVNDHQYTYSVNKIKKGLGDLRGKIVAVLGLAFKPQTDDVRESRSLKICEALLAEGCVLRVFDPAAMENGARLLPKEGVVLCQDAYDAVRGCDGIIVVTEWNEFRNMDLVKVKQSMRGNVLVDVRNIYNSAQAEELRFRYFGTGRGSRFDPQERDVPSGF
jgi:UDPglucose 6-dehydrogenase